MANTTNFGWETPDDTDLVKDGAAAIRTLGSAIDTSLVDLKGGTTGQILSKTSNTDMDFTWVTSAGDIEGVTAGTGISGGGTSGTVTITNSMATAIDAKGDLIAGTGADAFARLAVGANGTVLTADSAETTGLKWVAASSITGWSLLNAGGTSLSSGYTVTVSGLSAKQMLVIVSAAKVDTASGNLSIRFNSDSGANYTTAGYYLTAGSTYSANNLSGQAAYSTSTSVLLANFSSNTNSLAQGALFIDLADKTGWKYFKSNGSGDAAGGNDHKLNNYQGIYEGSAAITSISILSSLGQFVSGTVYIFGAN